VRDEHVEGPDAAPEPVLDLLMPVYNEGGNIARAIEEIDRFVATPKRLMIVYDFEEDDTLPVVRGLMARYPWVELVRNDRGRGVLNAIRSGIAAARAEVVIVTMADLSDDLTVVPEMVRLIREGGYDVVCASRYMPGGRQVGGPALKGFLSRMAGLSLYALGGLPVRDATNAFRAYRRDVLRSIAIESTGGFEYSLELTAKAHAMGRRITEVPSTWRDRTAGTSRFRLTAWLPKYLKWYFYALTHRPPREVRT
jgi:glycosyltransferase involved in cell wall biosynthesis